MTDRAKSGASGWLGSAEAMDRWRGGFRGAGDRAEAALLRQSGIKRGARVLEVGCGTGDLAIRMGGIVGDDGYVLATDISRDMIDAAAAKVAQVAYCHVAIERMDAARLDVPPASFDAALCRMGLMLFPDPAAALAGMRAALRPGGRVAVMVFSTAENNPMQEVPTTVIRERLGIAPPGPGEPHVFSVGAPGMIEALLRQAGFGRVTVERVRGEARPGSLANTLDLLRERIGGVRALMARADEATRIELWREIEAAMTRFVKDGEVRLPQEFLVASGTRPAGGE